MPADPAPTNDAILRHFARGHAVEVVEVKLQLSEGAIGQALAARVMLQEQYGLVADRTTILCSRADPALAWVCKNRGIGIDIAGSEPAGAGRRYRRDGERANELLRSYRDRTVGAILRNVGIGGVAKAWGSPAEIVCLAAVRIIDDPSTDVHEWDEDPIQESVEVIELAPRLVPDSIGRVLAGGDMFEHQFRTPVERRVIVCGTGDPALEWVCSEYGIDVEVADLPVSAVRRPS